ncbi:NADH-quinone oxidoreductase subunit NuoF [Enterococcus avium]|uniref:NADH-quinone oxidoreductase subunit NuoF n=1 Tax=Enterococcus avium TaxID=33945 RepID=UPI002890E7AB|nr:NADH-quinone oxidoreductase subunit NuoF [Enterococcus avium]MDT2394852.1 NADH-quinone oxidoreductase subunit NuoF [Enterococcus avium]MDT2419279.1 NADH-quinone oxidoreductase subunit NuoF [Enterococcus avium]MDT2432192.1 NADH-quinone oxidoreductase subunit NuoF [Enterococcus avium]MDT2441173.1 NADH-quinone oxidoreductase subunit NuoF [Enterococcus avium]MDT2454093.1 NADH-quinone oxidoreductase subunit NuoF [Enterococcus avium]
MKDWNELNELRNTYRQMITMRLDDEVIEGQQYEKEILICAGTGCISSKSGEFVNALKEELAKNELTNKVNIVKTGCFGLCAQGPIVIIYPEAVFYHQVQPKHAKKIVSDHLINGKLVEKLLYHDSDTKEIINKLMDTPFYHKQKRVALRNCGRINPEKIEEYFAFDGYQALATVVNEYSRDDVLSLLETSGLRGRGGAGFPTFMKWSFAKASQSDQKYVICNADEGDPGAFMDRSVLEGDPHAIIEAMAIAGYTIGANQGYIYVRAEYPIAVNRLRIAIKQAREKGLLGKNIFGSDFSFDLDLRLGAGAFVCGEETALLESIEGHRGEPRPRPPFPAVKGLFGKPTIVNNVETLANIPQIILKGPEWFASFGTEKSKGTKVFALGGKIQNTGLVEIPMGTTLREIVEDIGGGIPAGKKFKAAQTGGPSGGCIPAEHYDVPIDYENLKKIGSMMGSGGLIVMDEDNCMVDIAKFFLEFTVEESCGKCVPCRVGTKRLLEILEKITLGKATLDDLDRMEELCHHIQENSLCGLGQTAPNPVLSTLRYFREEYEAHVLERRCPSGVCKNLIQYRILPDKCTGCRACAKGCPVSAISGEVKQAHEIDQSICTKCGLCIDTCCYDAITVI